MIDGGVRELLEKQGYRVAGDHGAVKLCTWLRKSIRGEGHCYKQQFYGIESHRCLQMTPSAAWCTHNCIFCWRNTEATLGTEMTSWDEPEKLIDEAVERQRELVSGFGHLKSEESRKKYLEARNPRHAAISLAGEPTLYPMLGGLIGEFHRRGLTTYLVTNGTRPDVIAGLDELPTQLYMSLIAPNREVYRRTCLPIIDDGWESINRTLELFPSLDTRKVLRITLVKGYNMTGANEYAKLIEKAQPDYVEAKAYMFVGASRNRLTLDNMPSNPEVMDFAAQIAGETGYIIKDRKEDSRVVLLAR
ncbi:MAG: 4-demethylwyosine synthase TYW1 [Candidatus Altiarchaeota archaeon]